VMWRSRQGDTYRVQYKTSLTSPNWIDVSGDVTATGPISVKFHPTAAGPGTRRFYRVMTL
jgi:hypothetical protein